LSIEDARKKFVVDKTPEKKEIKKVENTTNNIINIELSKLVAFRKRQPFSMYDENKKQEVLESIKANGVLVPIIVRKIADEKYEIISGHNRVECSKELHLSTIPAQIVDCDDNKATLIMIDTNLCNRDKILPVEKGYAYKMKMEILKNSPNISNINEFIENSHDENNTSLAQIYRYIRLTELIKPLQDKVNSEIIPITAGVELSYLTTEEQDIVKQVIEDEQIKLSLVQAQKIRLKKNNITYESVLKIVKNEKIKVEKFTGKLNKQVFKEYKDRFNSDREFSILIKKLLDDYFRSDSDV
jgi:ParB family chromosome partitioning protein